MPSEALLETVRRELETEQSVIRAQLSELGYAEADDTGLEYDSNFADTSQVTAERSEAAALATTLREHLAEIEHAIDKLDNGTYGTCEKCGNAIDEARLEAIPAGRLCMACATARN